MRKLVSAAAFGVAATLMACAAPPALAQEKTGTSVSDLPVSYAMFSVHNPTKNPITYQVKWGSGAWDSTKILPGETYEHSYKLNAKGEFFPPSIRFDYILNDGKSTYKVYGPRPSQVVRGGFGPGGNTGTPKPYHFSLSADRRFLDLYAK